MRKLEDGNLKVVGRVKEQINRAGEKIMPSELEELIIKHPDIMDCAVIGIEDEMLRCTFHEDQYANVQESQEIDFTYTGRRLFAYRYCEKI